MAIYYSNPTVEGNLGLITKNIKVVTSDGAQPTFTAGKSPVIAELQVAGVQAGDVVHVTWSGGEVDFCLVLDESGLLLQKFALATT